LFNHGTSHKALALERANHWVYWSA